MKTTARSLPLMSWLALVAAVPSSAFAATVFTDNFDTAHDYSGGNVTGTIWDGVVNLGNASVLSATTTNAGELTVGITADSLGWDSGLASAPFLYKAISGDFDAQVQVTGATYGNYSVAGLMVRAANPLGDSIAGEDYVTITLDSFLTEGIQTRSIDDGIQKDLTLIQDDTIPLFLRLTRTGQLLNAYYGTNGSNWTQIGFWTGGGIQGGPGTNDYERPDLAGEVQVGLWHGSFSTLDSTAKFDNFSVTVIPEPATLTMALAGLIGLARRRRA